MENLLDDNDWQTLSMFFPEGWEEKARQSGAMIRARNIKTPSDLLRILLIHLSDNCSMKETVVRAKLASIADISSVALLKKIKSSSEWFRWMCNELLKKRGISIIPPVHFTKYNIKSVDASVISEPGSTGTDWRLHYSIELFGLKCDQFFITKQDKGESFVNFEVKANDLFIGDRAYGRYNGMKYILDNGGNFISRYKNRAFTLYNTAGVKYNLLEKLKPMKVGQCLEIKSIIRTGKGNAMPIRVIALKKSRQQADLSVRKAIMEQKKKQRTINPETIDYHRYIILLTSLPKKIKADEILELYRLRWQIEITFKHLKSIFGLGHLPKEDEESARSWLHGKLFVALLAQTIVDEGHLFSPWGYPYQCL
jgi:hypothetical protein